MTLMRVDQAFELNPRVKLARGSEAPFIDMASLQPFTRDVRAIRTKPYTGGTKFVDGDVLMARITPSLENGKTSIYRAGNTDGGPAFGSTEFIVIRGRKGVSDSTFAYYLFTSPALRDIAIASMNGSSGRQRVQQDVVASYVVNLPPLAEQRAIAATLGSLDDKIDSNRRAVELAHALAVEILSSGSEVVRVRDIARVEKGLSYKGAGLDDGRSGTALPLLNLANFTTLGSLKRDGLKHYKGEYKAKHRVSTWDLIIANTDLTQNREILGRGLLVPPDLDGALHTHHTSKIVFFARPELVLALWAQLQLPAFRDRAKGFATGTTVTALPADAVLDFELVVPDRLEHELLRARSLMQHAWQLESESVRLVELRNTLLPELLAGRLRAYVE